MVCSGVQSGHAGTPGGEASCTSITFPEGLAFMGTGVAEVTGVSKVFRESIAKTAQDPAISNQPGGKGLRRSSQKGKRETGTLLGLGALGASSFSMALEAEPTGEH